MKAKAICPASCGELLQGIIGKEEKLISYPIQLFSTVTIEEKKEPVRNTTWKKTFLGMCKTLQYFGESSKIASLLEITVQSDIPIGKGMASSTADVAAAITATAELLGRKLTPDELAMICVEVEPTDSTIFHSLTLFDHLRGIKIVSFDWNPEFDILVLEADTILDTQEFRKNDFSHLRIMNQPQVEKAYRLFERGIAEKNLGLLGESAILSALANQSILPKKNLEKIIELSLKKGCFGVNVAHSGTVIGILFKKKYTEIEGLIDELSKKNIIKEYTKVYLTKMVEGGTRIIQD